MAEMTLNRIVESGLCTGCGACVFAAAPGAVSMKMNSDVFLRPTAPTVLAPGDEEAIWRVCPGLGLQHAKGFDDGVQYFAEWGPVVELMAGHATDAEVRHAGPSGGVLSALLICLLDTKKVDFVVHTRASRNAPLVNETVFLSIKGTHQILERFNMQPVSVVNFRYRGDGWPGLARAGSHDGRIQTMDYNTALGPMPNQYLQEFSLPDYLKDQHHNILGYNLRIAQISWMLSIGSEPFWVRANAYWQEEYETQ